MGFFSKLLTAFRGATTEAGDAILDTQAIRILEQELRDAKKHLDEAKVIAEQMGVEREIKRLQKSIEEYENHAVQALDKGENQLAEEIAEKIADWENELNAQQNVLENYNNNISTLKQHIKDTEHHLKSMERELSVVKTTESVQKANAATAPKLSGSTSALRNASDSLERIKKKQQQKVDQTQAARELQQQESEGDLPDKLREKGILPDNVSSQSVLERIKAKRQS